jgi:hypothetical protein
VSNTLSKVENHSLQEIDNLDRYLLQHFQSKFVVQPLLTRALVSFQANGIPRMVRGYFYEMACVIQECFRVLKPGALLFMVNDNVRYAGASIPVDTILSDFAEKMGFTVESILVLPSDKGNSSQQMGNHGRDPLRKCVYVWKKP